MDKSYLWGRKSHILRGKIAEFPANLTIFPFFFTKFPFFLPIFRAFLPELRFFRLKSHILRGRFSDFSVGIVYVEMTYFFILYRVRQFFDNLKKVIFYVGKIIKISLKKVDFSSYGSEFFSLVNKFRHKVDRILIFISFSTQKSHILRGKIAKICLFLVHFS